MGTLLTRLDLSSLSGFDLESALPVAGKARPESSEAVGAILERVRTEGDAAVIALTRDLDGVAIGSVRLADAEIDASASAVLPELFRALEEAFDRLLAYHRYEAALDGIPGQTGVHKGGPAQGGAPAWVSGGITVERFVVPVDRAGIYAPGGRARYPSSVLMCTAAARAAGVSEIALCSPPGPDGRPSPATLAAARIGGVSEVYAIGGAQAVAAMAYGTETVKAVDVVAGPGNQYVAEAQRQVSHLVGTPGAYAGPSEVVVIAGEDASPMLVAMDLLVQAEHGPEGLAWLVTWSAETLEEVSTELSRLVAKSPRRSDLEATLGANGYAVLVAGVDEAMEVANFIAPEHLEIMCAGAEEMVPLVRSAGAVFVGERAPAALGDYTAGPNHVLPTARTARFASALSARDFVKTVHVVSVEPGGGVEASLAAAVIASAEGLPGHAGALLARLPVEAKEKAGPAVSSGPDAKHFASDRAGSPT